MGLFSYFECEWLDGLNPVRVEHQPLQALEVAEGVGRDLRDVLVADDDLLSLGREIARNSRQIAGVAKDLEKKRIFLPFPFRSVENGF